MMKRKIEALRVFIWIFFAAVFCGSVPAVFAETVFAAEISCCEVSGAVSGLQGTDYETAGVVLYNSVNAYQADVDAEGRYVFHRVVQDDYFLKIEADGYKVSKPIAVSVTSAAFTVAEHLQVEKVDDADFFYQWKADDTYFGYEEYAGVPEKKQITFLDEDVYVPDSHAAYKLFSRYNIILSNEQEKWSSEYTSRMFELVKDIRGYNQYQAPSKWILTDQHLEHDIKITYGENGNVVLVAKEAFTNAIPRKASLGKLKGSYFSNRLYHVLIRYITREGTDLAAVDNILRTDYGCSVIVEDYAMLTKDTTGETAAAFEQFKPEELLSILEMFGRCRRVCTRYRDWNTWSEGLTEASIRFIRLRQLCPGFMRSMGLLNLSTKRFWGSRWRIRFVWYCMKRAIFCGRTCFLTN